MLANIVDTVTAHPGLMFLIGCIFVLFCWLYGMSEKEEEWLKAIINMERLERKVDNKKRYLKKFQITVVE